MVGGQVIILKKLQMGDLTGFSSNYLKELMVKQLYGE